MTKPTPPTRLLGMLTVEPMSGYDMHWIPLAESFEVRRASSDAPV